MLSVLAVLDEIRGWMNGSHHASFASSVDELRLRRCDGVDQKGDFGTIIAVMSLKKARNSTLEELKEWAETEAAIDKIKG